jgi:hypothetical protein
VDFVAFGFIKPKRILWGLMWQLITPLISGATTHETNVALVNTGQFPLFLKFITTSSNLPLFYQSRW